MPKKSLLTKDTYTIDELLGLLSDAKVQQSLNNRLALKDSELSVQIDDLGIEVDFKFRIQARALVPATLITSACYLIYIFLTT